MRKLCLLLCLMLSACASTFQAETTVFHQWPIATASKGQGYRLVSLPGTEQSLERTTYENIIRQQLATFGLLETEPAKLQISFQYGAKELRRLASNDPWGRPSVYLGGGWGRGGVVLGGTIPIGGVAVREELVFERSLSLLIEDSSSGSPKRIYEGKALALDQGRSAVLALPYLVRALLVDFPGVSGLTKTVTLPLNKD